MYSLVARIGFELTIFELVIGVGFGLVIELDSQRIVDNNIHHRFLIGEVGNPVRQIWKGGTNDEEYSDF